MEFEIQRFSNKGPSVVPTTERPVHVATRLVGQRSSKVQR